MIVLDFGSGNTCRNEAQIVKRMIDGLADVTDRRDIVIKWQLFESVPPNRRLYPGIFLIAYQYAAKLGFRTTASVFDKPSLEVLLRSAVPFVKLANNPKYHQLAADIPRGVPIVASYDCGTSLDGSMMAPGIFADHPLCCVSQYPAPIELYEERFTSSSLSTGISDHTVGFDLYHRYRPSVWEKHYVLQHDDDNPDAGPFAATPEELKEEVL